MVLGGGNVTIDVARSVLRLGSCESNIIYRRRKVDMPAMKEEIDNAIAESYSIYELCSPLRIEADTQGKSVALWVQPQIVGKLSGNRPVAMDAKESPHRIAFDMIIIVIGQGIETREFEKEEIPVKRGLIEAFSSADVKDILGVYAGGDCISSPATVIKVIAAGKVATANIDNYLSFHHEIKVDIELSEPNLSDRTPCDRVNMKNHNVHSAVNVSPIAQPQPYVNEMTP